MPELPDVSVFKKYLDSTSLHQRIGHVDVIDKGVLGEVGPRQLPKALRGRQLVSSRQHGKVLHTAIDCKVDADQFPASYLLPHRKEGEPCPRCDGTIVKQKVSGRSSYYCNDHQVFP